MPADPMAFLLFDFSVLFYFCGSLAGPATKRENVT